MEIACNKEASHEAEPLNPKNVFRERVEDGVDNRGDENNDRQRKREDAHGLSEESIGIDRLLPFMGVRAVAHVL